MECGEDRLMKFLISGYGVTGACNDIVQFVDARDELLFALRFDIGSWWSLVNLS